MSEQVRKLSLNEAGQDDKARASRPTTDIPALMAQIRERIKTDVASSRDSRPTLTPTSVRFSKEKVYRPGALQLSENLRFLNVNFAPDSQLIPTVIPTHRKGPVGRLLPKVKRFGRAVLRKLFLADYFYAEREFNAHLVRHINDIGRYIDMRDQGLLENVNLELERIKSESSAAVFGLQQDITALSQNLTSQVASLDSLVRGLEGILNNHGTYTDPNPPQATESTEQKTSPDISYLLLENRYRGGEAEIERRLSIYPEILASAQGPVLEIGSGRGELQTLLKKRGIETYGVDLDNVMVNVANSHGCDTRYGDGIAHLRSLVDNSLGGLIAIQVVEHLTRHQLKELCDLAKAKCKPGGKIIFETINPQSLLALSSNYFRDPTHVWPMHPDTLGYTATLAGLKIVETRYLSPVSANYLLKEVPAELGFSPIVGDAIKRINANMQQLNRLLYGYQDYCLVLEVP